MTANNLDEDRSYLVEEIDKGDPLHPRPVQTVTARNAREALALVIGARPCRLLSSRWIDARARDHHVAHLVLEGKEVTLRASRWVS